MFFLVDLSSAPAWPAHFTMAERSNTEDSTGYNLPRRHVCPCFPSKELPSHQSIVLPSQPPSTESQQLHACIWQLRALHLNTTTSLHEAGLGNLLTGGLVGLLGLLHLVQQYVSGINQHCLEHLQGPSHPGRAFEHPPRVSLALYPQNTTAKRSETHYDTLNSYIYLNLFLRKNELDVRRA